jgi:two-component system copper resistance phosphate regulon response regulator CusR
VNILIIEDDPLISRFMERGLAAAGFATTTATDAAGGRALGLSGFFDLVLLDVVLGADDGFTLLAELRRNRSTMPVLVVTGNPTHRDVVACLESGADDYLVKPFRLEELLARVRARLRTPPAARATSALTSGDITMDLLTRRVVVAGREVELTSREFALLEVLVRHAGQVLSREQLLSQVWGYSFDPGSNVVSVFVGTLRHKIGHDAIETVRGAGYRLRAAGATQLPSTGT